LIRAGAAIWHSSAKAPPSPPGVPEEGEDEDASGAGALASDGLPEEDAEAEGGAAGAAAGVGGVAGAAAGAASGCPLAHAIAPITIPNDVRARSAIDLPFIIMAARCRSAA
jgi:hypothetical protein